MLAEFFDFDLRTIVGLGGLILGLVTLIYIGGPLLTLNNLRLEAALPEQHRCPPDNASETIHVSLPLSLRLSYSGAVALRIPVTAVDRVIQCDTSSLSCASPLRVSR